MPAPADVSSPHPSIRALQAVVERTAPSRSRERVRQLTMTVRQLERALDAGALSDDAGQGAAILLDPENTDDFLDTAWDGRWRDKPERGELSYASMSVLRACLNILGQEAGVEVLLPRMGQPAPKPTVPPAQQAALYRGLAERAVEEVPAGGWPDRRSAVRGMGRVRLLAMVGVVLDTGARAGELSAMRLDDLDVGLGVVRVRRMPQNGSGVPVVEPPCALREGTRVAVRRWLRIRQALVERVHTATDPRWSARDALWVSVSAGPGQPVAGLPLMPRGVERAYARGAGGLNVELAGRWDPSTDGPWVPLPTRLEQLRRSVVLSAPEA